MKVSPKSNLLESYGIDLNYFPGWVRKAVTFTMDDGIIQHDEKFLSIVRPAGILGTFNLYMVNLRDADIYRELYIKIFPRSRKGRSFPRKTNNAQRL